MRIIHFGDLHVWRFPFAPYDALFFKRYLGAFNLLFHRRKKFPPALGKKVLDSILSEKADLVVFSGYLTTSAQKNEFALAKELLQPIEDKWGDKFFMIPGNHDRYTSKSCKQDWYGGFFPKSKINGVRVQPLTEDTIIIGYDASRQFLLRSNGEFNDELAQQLESVLQHNADKKIIMVGHYPVDYPEEVKVDPHHEMINRSHLKSLMEKYPPVLYLHGHKHIRWQINTAVNCGSAGMLSDKPNQQAGYCVIDLDPVSKAILSVEMKEIFLLKNRVIGKEKETAP